MNELDEVQERFRRFAATTTPRAPLYAQLAARIADDPEVAALLLAAPPTQRAPVLLLAATHDVVLAGVAPELALHYRNLNPLARPETDPWPAFRELCRRHADELRATVATRHTQTNEVGRCALFLPLYSLLAHETGQPIAQVDVGTSAGLTLLWPSYGYRYEPGPTLGADSEVMLPCGVRGAAPLPHRLPPHVPGVGLDLRPIDVTDDTATRWLEACVWPDQADRFHRLAAALARARNTPPVVHEGDAVADVARLVRGAAASGHPVVTTSWALSYLTTEQQAQFTVELDRLGQETDLSWIAAESPAQTPGLRLPHPPGSEHLTVLTLRTWRSGMAHTRAVATTHPHGYWMHWHEG